MRNLKRSIARLLVAAMLATTLISSGLATLALETFELTPQKLALTSTVPADVYFGNIVKWKGSYISTSDMTRSNYTTPKRTNGALLVADDDSMKTWRAVYNGGEDIYFVNSFGFTQNYMVNVVEYFDGETRIHYSEDARSWYSLKFPEGYTFRKLIGGQSVDDTYLAFSAQKGDVLGILMTEDFKSWSFVEDFPELEANHYLYEYNLTQGKDGNLYIYSHFNNIVRDSVQGDTYGVTNFYRAAPMPSGAASWEKVGTYNNIAVIDYVAADGTPVITDTSFREQNTGFYRNLRYSSSDWNSWALTEYADMLNLFKAESLSNIHVKDSFGRTWNAQFSRTSTPLLSLNYSSETGTGDYFTPTILWGEADMYTADEFALMEGVTLPMDALQGITDSQSATAAIDAAINAMTPEQASTSIGIDLLTLFAEEALAMVSTTIVQDNDIFIGSGIIDGLARADGNAQYRLQSAGIPVARTISPSARIQTTATGPVTVTIDVSASVTWADTIRIDTPTYSISMSKDAIAAVAADGPLVITVEAAGGGTAVTSRAIGLGLVAAVTDSASYKVEVNKELSENFKVSFPPASGDTDYQAIVKEDGTAVGGKYNPANGRLETKINSGGTYTVKQNEKSFSDITAKTAEMQQAIKILASKGIINGTSETAFSPDGSITRAEIAALVVRTLSKLDANANGGFTDVVSADWFYGAVGSAKRHGIVNGVTDTTFDPRSTIRKDAIVAICARTLSGEINYTPIGNPAGYLAQYSDRTSIPEWAEGEVALATRENLVVRSTNGAFSAATTMTRGDAAVILYRMFMKIW